VSLIISKGYLNKNIMILAWDPQTLVEIESKV